MCRRFKVFCAAIPRYCTTLLRAILRHCHKVFRTPLHDILCRCMNVFCATGARSSAWLGCRLRCGGLKFLPLRCRILCRHRTDSAPVPQGIRPLHCTVFNAFLWRNGKVFGACAAKYSALAPQCILRRCC